MKKTCPFTNVYSVNLAFFYFKKFSFRTQPLIQESLLRATENYAPRSVSPKQVIWYLVSVIH